LRDMRNSAYEIWLFNPMTFWKQRLWWIEFYSVSEGHCKNEKVLYLIEMLREELKFMTDTCPRVMGNDLWISRDTCSTENCVKFSGACWCSHKNDCYSVYWILL
jgi:hypothetical protein